MAEPIDLDKLSVALAASIVSAQRYLHQANQDLQELYDGTESLSGLPRPRFSLGEVSFEVPYVVDSIQTPAEVIPPDVRLTKDVSLSESEMASLKRGATPEAAEQLTTLLSDYAQVKASLRSATSDTQTPMKNLKISVPQRLAPAVILVDSVKVELQAGASKSAVGKFQQLLEDYDAARTSLVRIKEVVSGGGLPRLSVRVDAEAVEKAAASNLHRLTLRIRSDDQSVVKVQGQNIT